MVSRDVFLLPPAAAALVLLSNLLTIADAVAVLPQKTQHLPFRVLDVVDWPLQTPMPWLGRRQDSSTNTVCGYIGGDPGFAATCSAGSHCAMDASVSAVGCCPNGVACTTGVYTSCVDQNSPTPSAYDPYVYTCQGSNVCYKNTYDGGAYQYGCGTSTQGFYVAATASGLSTTVSITHVSGIVTKAASTASSSSSGSSSASSSDSSTTSSSSTTTTSSSSSSSPTSQAPSSTSSHPAASGGPHSPPTQAQQDAALARNGGIIGGTVAGAAIFVAIVSVAFWMGKRKGRNQRVGPGQGKGPSYISPMTNQKDFTQVPGQDTMFDQAGYGHPSMMPGAHGTTTSITGGNAAHSGGSVKSGGAGGAVASGAVRSGNGGEDEIPLTHQNEMTEFLRGYHEAISRPEGDEVRQGSAGGNSTATGATATEFGAAPNANAGGGDITEERPLWQQNRRQSRNLMWIILGTEMSSPNLHVAIIGAVSVFETLPRQTYEDNPRTWTMALHWSRRNVEQCLPPELFAALSSAHTNPWHEPSHDEAQSLPVVDGKTGEVLVAAKVDDGRRVVRRKLRDLFRRGIDVRFGYKLAGVDTSGEGVTATFENGEVVRVDVIVGADGEHWMSVHGGAGSISQEQDSPDCQLADVPDPEDPETWEFQVALSLWSTEDPPETNEDRMKYFKKLAEPYCEPYRSAALWVPDDTYIPRDKYAEWKRIAPWKNFGGRVTVAGDAAHPMCPFRGQGLNNALQDAGNLVKAITAVKEGRQTLAAAIDEYDAEVYQRGKREIEISEESMFGLHHYSAIKGSPIDRMGLKEQKA
ncbi:hypothetical protein CCHR01_07593 [Colletotrichum chrysophilum]|uniref:FAD-binding domain-containing protein n=1 Tax=Colletotrichum chrysophilum TaxID=1836956 RepID=A0AAD9ANC4_9PEZI|nr:hypothetical protein CCHR01_07593 [Colletotrichum chrysophilum]